MNRTGKYKDFPELKAGDLVVCGKHTAYIVTGEGGYKLIPANDKAFGAWLCAFADDFEKLLDNIYDCNYRDYIPEAVFRPSSGYVIPPGIISNMIADWRSVSTHNERFSRIWSVDDDDTKELTVDEVSELLGYKVKIVGVKN